MKIGVAILGLGTVGYGVYDILNTNEYCEKFEVIKILDKDLSKQELVNNKITTNYLDILNNKDIKIVVETMGASAFSYKCIREAIVAKKNVVTANKEVIADHLKELTDLKNEYGVSLYYEASVGGGIPVIKPLHLIALTNDVSEINGILNGTTNYILTKMTYDQLSFNEALKLAQKEGFAEADPTADLEGLDMVRKIAILSSICFKSEIELKNIYHYGISNISDIDIIFAKKHNYSIKLIASSKKEKTKNGSIDADIRIEPNFIGNDNIISKVRNEFNIINVKASINGDLMFYGKGAGRYPTANAIVNDIIMINNNDLNYSFKELNKVNVRPFKEKKKYYLRVKDINKLNKEDIEIIEDNKIITKEIYFDVIKKELENIYFYARIGE